MGDHIERLNEKVGLARTRVKRYLRKGESGKVEDVEAYIRKGAWAKPGTPEYEEEVGKFRKMLGESGGVTPITRKTPGQRSSAQAAALRAQPSSQGKTGSTKAREEAAREYRKKNPSPKQSTFLGHDSKGNEIKPGYRARIEAGPDKGNSGIITGQAKGGGITIEIKQNLSRRTVVVDPDELRVLTSAGPVGPVG